MVNGTIITEAKMMPHFPRIWVVQPDDLGKEKGSKRAAFFSLDAQISAHFSAGKEPSFQMPPTSWLGAPFRANLTDDSRHLHETANPIPGTRTPQGALGEQFHCCAPPPYRSIPSVGRARGPIRSPCVEQRHQRQVLNGLRRRLVVVARPAQPEQLTLPADAQHLVRWIDPDPLVLNRSWQLFF